MEQELLNEQELPAEGALNNDAVEQSADNAIADFEDNQADAEADELAGDESDAGLQNQVETEDYSKFERSELLTKLNLSLIHI